uniref:Endoplasmic reticulum junction formation protein lunapark n=1 Tax=Schistocephalus solidus TaxID=70667 RepID=A0A0X3PJV9_SCHSO
METQTYNRANQLLRRFDPHGIFQAEHMAHIPNIGLQKELTGDSSVINRRPCAPVPQATLMKTPQTQIRKATEGLSKFSVPPQLPPTPINVPLRHRPILPRERSVLDKVLDALVGDGPDRRYALICCRCASHNGMALAEEFEFLAFKCCYCDFFNPARRVRRNSLVPKLETFPSPTAGPTAFTTTSSSTLRSRRVYSTSLANLTASETPNARVARLTTASEEDVFVASTKMEVKGSGSLSHLSPQLPLSRLVEDSPPTGGSPTPPDTPNREIEEDTTAKSYNYKDLNDGDVIVEERVHLDNEQQIQNSPDPVEVSSRSVFHD